MLFVYSHIGESRGLDGSDVNLMEAVSQEAEDAGIPLQSGKLYSIV